MTCDHVREQLLELPVTGFGPLDPHLEKCPACAALANRIRHQENQMDAYLDDYTHGPTFDASYAAARPTPLHRLRWPAVGATLAIAAAAALWIAAGGPPSEGVPPGPSEPGLAASTDGVDTVRIGRGRSALLRVRPKLAAISIVDPGVATVVTAGEDMIQVQGLSTGRSQLVATDEDGEREVWWIDVHVDSDAPIRATGDSLVAVPTDAVTLRRGERRFVDLGDVPRAVAVTDPALVTVLMAGPSDELAIDGLSDGTTDILVSFDDRRHMWVVTVEP